MHSELYGVEFEVIKPWVAGVLVIVIGAVVFAVLVFVTRRGGH
jgi:hypothetical protein